MSPSRCRFCDHGNPEGARFCNGCGSPLHLKPCPQCEAVNDTAAAQCYECGAVLETNAPTGAVTAIPTPAAADTEARHADADTEDRHVPDAFGARFESLPPIEEHANVAAAERRDAHARSNRTSRALFFAIVLLILGGFGYYGYQHRAAGDANGGAAPATAQDENRAPAAEAPRIAAELRASRMMRDPVPGDVDATAHPDAVVPLDVIEKALQRPEATGSSE